MADDDIQVPADSEPFRDPQDEQREAVGAAQDFIRGWLDSVWRPAAEGVTSRDESVVFAAPYSDWEVWVVQLRILVGGMEPERHFGVIRLVEGGDPDA